MGISGILNIVLIIIIIVKSVVDYKTQEAAKEVQAQTLRNYQLTIDELYEYKQVYQQRIDTIRRAIQDKGIFNIGSTFMTKKDIVKDSTSRQSIVILNNTNYEKILETSKHQKEKIDTYRTMVRKAVTKYNDLKFDKKVVEDIAFENGKLQCYKEQLEKVKALQGEIDKLKADLSIAVDPAYHIKVATNDILKGTDRTVVIDTLTQIRDLYSAKIASLRRKK